jgi:peptidoglycan/xylan/chitin deacetylase (PgdA/CDA1 family)
MNAPARVLILNYHRIADDPGLEPLFSVYPSVLLSHLKLLKKLNIPVISLSDAVNNSVQNDFSVVLTFDDGYESDYKTVVPLLKQFGYTAAFFPIIEKTGSEGRLSWENIGEMAAQGFTIGSHGYSHCDLSDVGVEYLIYELLQSKMAIERNTGVTVQHLALPHGSYNKTVLKMATACGYKSVLTTGLKMNCGGNSPLFCRWTITAKTTFEQFMNVVQCGGNLPATVRIANGLRQYARNILGGGLSDKINRIASNVYL